MTEEGWVKQHRAIFSHWVNEDHRAFHLWSYLIAEVNFSEGKTMIEGKMKKVMPGQTITSIDKLSKSVKISWKKTKELIDAFMEDDMIKVKKIGRRGLLITVCNYEKFQSTLNSDRAEVRAKVRTKVKTEVRADVRTEVRQYKKGKKDIKKDKECKESAARADLWGRGDKPE